MSLPGQMNAAMEVPSDPAPCIAPSIPSLSTIQAEVDRISHKVDACLAEILTLKTKGGTTSQAVRGTFFDTYRQNEEAMKESSKGFRPLGTFFAPSEGSLRTAGDSSDARDVRGSPSSEESQRVPRQLAALRQSYSSTPEESKAPRIAVRAGGIDLESAWKLHAKQMYEGIEEVDYVQPVMRLVHRTRLENLWEFLEDPDSSRLAWWTWNFLKVLVVISMLVSSIEAAETPMMNLVAVAVWETILDSIFLLETILRVISSPSKKAYLVDSLNWADLLTAFGLPLRISIGFVIDPTVPKEDWKETISVILLLFLPLVRFLKLLRYFEALRLLIDAFVNSAESLPVLAYILSLIVAFGSTFIYLFEERSNIPSLQHSTWLAIVTMTSVGYGDLFPTTLEGYITVSLLTFTSVLFVALPIGIIRYEFTNSWQNRVKVLLINKTRKCLEKWGYSARDVKVLFDYVDVDGDGSLNLSEFIELIRQMRIGISVEKAFDIFSLFDDDQNGSLDCIEFLRHVFPEEYVKNQQESELLFWSGGDPVLPHESDHGSSPTPDSSSG
ncbi:unnamed protein product [Durusdinium trenchii]|uniref:EF-hand domain-containing protein n=1 Tax=Durusdinium trenchii TaxID=1381693 RepID=A0ABP0QQ42_9DINO